MSLREAIESNISKNNGDLVLPDPSITVNNLEWLIDQLIDGTGLTITGATLPSPTKLEVTGQLTLFSTKLLTTAAFDAKDSSLALTASLAKGETIDFGMVVGKLLQTAPPPMSINSLELKATPTNTSYSADIGCSDWQAPLGAKGLDITGLSGTISYAGGKASAQLKGTAEIGGNTIAVTYDLPGDFELDLTIPKIDLSAAINHFLTSDLALPAGFPTLQLTDSTAKISKQKSDYTMVLDTSVNSWGELQLEVLRKSGAWQAATGIALLKSFSLSQISSVFKSFDGLLSDAGMVISSFDDSGFSFTQVKVPSIDGVDAGVSFGGKLALQGSVLENVAKILGNDPLVVSGAIAKTMSQSFFKVEKPGSVTIPPVNNLSFSDPYLKLQPATPLAASVGGNLSIPIGDQALKVDGHLAIDPTSAKLVVDAKLPPSLQAPMAFTGIGLEEIGISLGVIFEPPGLDLGMQGTLLIGKKTRSTEKFAFEFAVVGDLVNPILLSCDLENVSLTTLFEAVCPSQKLPSELGMVSFPELGIYWAEKTTTLPDGSSAEAGYGFNSLLAIGSWRAYAMLKIRASSGIDGQAALPPINIGNGAVTLKGSGTGGKGVPSGGPFLQVSTTSSPYLSASADAKILGMTGSIENASLAADGLSFTLKNSIYSYLDSSLSVSMKDNLSASFSSAISSDFKVDVGPIKFPNSSLVMGVMHVSATFKGSLQIKLDTSGFLMKISGGFSWGGKSWTMPDISVTEAPKDLSQLIGTITGQIKSRGEDIFSSLFSDYVKYLQLIAQKLITGFSDPIQILIKVYGLTLEEAIKQLQSCHVPVNTKVHVDTPGVHTDKTSPHIDVPSTHADGSKWGVHGDVGTPHSDSRPHVDTRLHIDKSQHVDL